MLSNETRDVCVLIRDELKMDFSRPQSLHVIFTSAETLIAALASLTSPLIELESAYHNDVRGYIEDGKSATAAEALAKAGEAYKDWKKVKMIYELAQEQIMLLKKFHSAIEDEYART